MNSTVTLPLPGPAGPGQTVDVRFVMRVQQTGRFRFLINVEAAP
ncbi:MAG: hypothetical protein ACRD9R_15155 [Pyrinomonadaceae bacterium]